MTTLMEEAARVVGALNSAGVEYALAGGLAVSLYVRPRATLDIDLLVAAADCDKAVSALAGCGYQELTSPLLLPRITIRRVTRMQDEDMFFVDLLVAGHDLISLLAERQTVEWKGQPVPVLLPDSLIHLKELRNSPQDAADIALLRRAMEEHDNPPVT